jgi:CHAD domain-containing protein
VRIDVKRLRYSIDALAPSFRKSASNATSDILVALQDALGQANDAVTAARLCRSSTARGFRHVRARLVRRAGRGRQRVLNALSRPRRHAALLALAQSANVGAP